MSASKITKIGLVSAVIALAALLGIGYGVSHASDKPPSPGTAAPDFTLNSQEGTPVSLHDYH